MKQLTLLKQQEVLGKDFKVYGDIEDPLFLAKDVAEWIEHSNSRMMLQGVDEDEKVVRNVYTPGGIQESWFLTEQGLYEVLMQSRKPIAKAFKKEVKAILKQIRMTGGTVIEGREDEFIANYFPSFSEEVKLAMVQDLRVQNNKLKIELSEQAPKVEYYQKILDSEGLLTTTEVAKQLGFKSAQQLNGILYQMGILRKVNGNWVHYADYNHLVVEGYIKYIPYLHGSQQLKWTEKGRAWLIEKVLPAHEQRQRILNKRFIYKESIV